jgi:hypothetical protein
VSCLGVGRALEVALSTSTCASVTITGALLIHASTRIVDLIGHAPKDIQLLLQEVRGIRTTQT